MIKWITLALLCMVLGCRGSSAGSSRQPGVLAMRKDAELETAIKQSQARLPEFLARLAHPHASDRFAVQGRFSQDGVLEHLWIDSLSFDGKQISGRVADQPIVLKTVQKGQLLTLKTKDVDDWMIREASGNIIGGFANKVLERKLPTNTR
jgi:uncharacterized protein YegJ (DUF2314 family)